MGAPNGFSEGGTEDGQDGVRALVLDGPQVLREGPHPQPSSHSLVQTSIGRIFPFSSPSSLCFVFRSLLFLFSSCSLCMMLFSPVCVKFITFFCLPSPCVWFSSSSRFPPIVCAYRVLFPISPSVSSLPIIIVDPSFLCPIRGPIPANTENKPQ